MASELVLGINGQLLRPDAIEDFGASNSEESSVIFRLRGKAWAPAGVNGEVVMRRLYVLGYHRAAVRMYVTPVVDGRYLNELRTYLSKPAPSTGRQERFSFLVPVAKTHPDFPDRTFGLRGSVFEAEIETSDPLARFYVEALVFAHRPINRVRARGVDE